MLNRTNQTKYKGGVTMKFLKDILVTRPADGFNFECIDKQSAVTCILFNSDYTKVCFTDQFRAGTNSQFLEAPAGIVEPKESYKEALFREVEEETGYSEDMLDDVSDLGAFYPSPGYTSEVISIWCARVIPGVTPNDLKLDENELITLKWISINNVQNVTTDMKTILGLAKALARPKMRIGIYGGTFNPVTYLHLLTGERAIEEFKLDLLIFEPVGNSYVKKENIIPTLDRLNMLNKALDSNATMISGTYESSQMLQPASIDTLTYYQKKYPWSEIFFICGSDVLQDMANWPRTNKLLEQFNVICIQRKSASVHRDIILTSTLLTKYKDKIHIIYENVLNDVSASIIRKLARSGQSIRYLTPDSVIDYINENNLYKQ
jgi:nicotinate (nicotinamide) nucleotide adenylyltransferase